MAARLYHIEDHRPRWYAGNAWCDACGHRWPVVLEQGVIDVANLECQKCHRAAGSAEAIVAFPLRLDRAIVVAKRMAEAL